MALENFQREWSEMDDKFKWVIGAIVLVGVIVLIVKAVQPEKTPADAAQAQQSGPQARNAIAPINARVLPESQRNQGVEELQTQVLSLQQQVSQLVTAAKDSPNRFVASNPTSTSGAAGAGPAASAPSAAAASLESVIPSVDFSQPGDRGKAGAKSTGMPSTAKANGLDAEVGAPLATEPPRTESPQLKIWPADAALEKPDATDLGGPVIPVNSALESVMLSGINARPSGSIAGAAGSVNSANNVGAPFVTRLKGDAILPNGWKVADLGDCFLGGSGIAILSAERAYVIADNLSCIQPNGEVYEAPVKAYGLDVDGTNGIAGRVVSKQGALLLQAALTGMASGLGAALSPSSIPSYNSNATNGSTASVQFPNPAAVAQTAVGQGINQAAAQLSKFYLDYAKEIFPVIEVVAGTRVTWVLRESVELKKQTKKVALK